MATAKKVNVRKSSDISLKLECYDDELSPAQLAAFNRSESQFNEALKKIENIIKKSNGTIVDNNDSTTLIRFPTNIGNQLQQSVAISTGGSPIITNAGIVKSKVVPTSVANLTATSTLKTAAPSSLVALQSPQVAVTSGSIVTSNIQQGGTYQLVMDPRLGLLVSTVAPQPASPATSTQVTIANNSSSVVQNSTSSLLKPAVQNTTPTIIKKAPQSSLTGPRRTYSTTSVLPQAQVAYNTTNQTSNSFATKQKTVPVAVAQVTQNKKSNSAVIDLTEDDTMSDSREINFNNLSGKTFPSLVVVARPHLKMKDMTQAAINEERKYFNDRVKGVLMFTPTKFTEWLIQQGLVRSEHYCSTHQNPDNTAIKLKLGMYSDLTKFPYSGGYVWISDCCPQRFVSVFSGSIFEGAPHAPSVLLKLLYHWCSQTSVQNVVQWVKVEKVYVKTFFTNLRAVCTAAISEKYEKLGGQDKKIEVGVISLGTTSADGSMRQVKVEVLGVMDTEKKLIRLRAIEPLQDAERNYKKRFVKILEPLEQWVYKESTVLTDNTVDKSTLLAMGFKSIVQVSIHESNSTNYRNSNFHVMEYLRRVVPRMFQNTLSLLSRQIIQQFLDELVWREKWGHIPSRAFDSIIAHIAEQTKIDSGETLTLRLSKIASNPFRSWTYSTWFPINSRNPSGSRPLPPSSSGDANAKRAKRKITSTVRNSAPADSPTPATTPVQTQKNLPTAVAASPSKELTSLESYYYGTLPGDPVRLESEKKYKLNMKCCSCRSVLSTNIHMMRHLIGHAFNEGAYGTENSQLSQCRYCLKNFVSETLLQSHLEEKHLKAASSLMCLICEERFNDRTTLILHMHRCHSELELPYACNICGFRTSEHRLVVDHFYDVHSEGEKVQCPYCLKIVAFSSNGRKVTQNLYFFLSHIQKHTRKSIARKCNSCALWFVHKGILKEHKHKDHSSCKGMDGIERYICTGFDTILMPKPMSPGPLAEKNQAQKSNNLLLFINESFISTNFTANKFEPKIVIAEPPSGATCCECEGDVTEEDHFQGYLSCLRCRFCTCCSKAMTEHNIIFHDSKVSKEFNVGKITILDKQMHCVCGFKSASGNKLAKHLVMCGRKSAYPSAARAAQSTLQAQSASFPPLVTLDDQDAEADPSDKWLQAFVSRKDKEELCETEKEKTEKTGESSTSGGSTDPPSMLNVLGLVRKQSLDESSLDKPASDSESSPQDDASKIKVASDENDIETPVIDQPKEMDVESKEGMKPGNKQPNEEPMEVDTIETSDPVKV